MQNVVCWILSCLITAVFMYFEIWPLNNPPHGSAPFFWGFLIGFGVGIIMEYITDDRNKDTAKN